MYNCTVMTRKVNEKLTEDIIKVLKNHPEGTYISEIARELNISKSIVAYVINTRLKNKIEDIKTVGSLFRLIKLK